MAVYTGAKCLSCEKEFTENDDIVVCPECGTPYHRECYLKEGKCINDKLHEVGGDWNDFNKAETERAKENDEDTEDTIRCIRCGTENSSDKLFCENCGTPLMNIPTEEVPFNNMGNTKDDEDDISDDGMGAPKQLVFDKDSDLDGIKLIQYAKYVRNNPLGILSNFIRFSKFKVKWSMNIWAFFIPHIYFIYRKMIGIGSLIMILMSIFNAPAMMIQLSSGYMGYHIDFPFDVTTGNFIMAANIGRYLSLALSILCGLFANFWYFKKAKKDINKINEVCENEDEKDMILKTKGGTSMALGLLAVFANCFLEVGIMYLCMIFLK